jgi:signal transduction histidine kinase
LKYFEDGKGFEPKDINHGMGLKNIDNRAKSIGAKYSFKTVPGKGVSFELVMNF